MLALVTGSSTGIGVHIAEQLAERGYEAVTVGASPRARAPRGTAPS
ncbi:hypothetical protein [uncultured Corynebacterium sp.]|nr:hypothetical protein [uncultured Corynebacterium sp.]